jgi:Lon protease-like protein
VVRAPSAAFAWDRPAAALAPGADRRKFARVLKRYLNHRDLDIDWETANAAPLEALVNSLAMGLPFDPAEKQALLEALDFSRRFEVLTALLEIGGADDGDDEPRSLQ